MSTRATAARVLLRVIQNRQSLTPALELECFTMPSGKDRAFVQALCYGTLRWYFRLNIILSHLLRKPLKKKDTDIQMLALLGLYQLAYTRVKPHAAVAETVSAAKHKVWAKSLLNAVLRTYQRAHEQIDNVADHVDEGLTGHPDWLLSEFRKSWPEQINDIVRENNQHPPMVLRVNPLKCSRDIYLGLLSRAGFNGIALTTCDTAVRLTGPVDVGLLPGFSEGMVSVQDEAAQIAAKLLDVRPGHRVLDGCAAPGGKTLHILETCPEIDELVAVDIVPDRIRRICENLARSGLAANVITGDLANPSEWWKGRLFDRILLDVPCSGTGVIRRHPDIKILRKPDDIPALCRKQRQILRVGWSLLAPRGVLIYATCSILRQENDIQIQDFLKTHQDALEWRIEDKWGIEKKRGRQILPGDTGMDGFYYARLKRSA